MFDRNSRDRVRPLNPVPRHPDETHTGNAGIDGYTRLAQAHPDFPGYRPSVPDVLPDVTDTSET